MAAKPGIQPKDLLASVQQALLQTPGEWRSPAELWDYVRRTEPGLSEQVKDKVRQYRDPARNNEIWFLSNTLFHLNKTAGFTVSDVGEVPEMKGRSFWLIARADPK